MLSQIKGNGNVGDYCNGVRHPHDFPCDLPDWLPRRACLAVGADLHPGRALLCVRPGTLSDGLQEKRGHNTRPAEGDPTSTQDLICS